MKNEDIQFQVGQIVISKNIIAEVIEVKEDTVVLELSNHRGITEVPKRKVHLVTFGMEFF